MRLQELCTGVAGVLSGTDSRVVFTELQRWAIQEGFTLEDGSACVKQSAARGLLFKLQKQV